MEKKIELTPGQLKDVFGGGGTGSCNDRSGGEGGAHGGVFNSGGGGSNTGGGSTPIKGVSGKK